MATNLVIVESPAKAKTISKYLGSDFVVKPSFGHIRDLAKKNYGIDIENGFEPKYEIDPEKKHVVAELKKDVKAADTVWLASDEDREGEAIAWHLAVTLKLPVDTTKRIVFHEITKNAIQDAIKNPRVIDMNLVNAQQARRILDRLVGFELSEVLWKKVKSSLSAGRVQSVAVKLVVEREREIFGFKPQIYYKPVALFTAENAKTPFKAEYDGKISTSQQAENLINTVNGSAFNVKSVETKPGKRVPAPPFTTSTLQQEASRKLGFSVSQTMTLAQSLYESGHITYMRTDSVNLSDYAIAGAKDYIIKEYGQEYSHPRNFKTKTKGAQEAHEAIRPTSMKLKVSQKDAEQRLYEIIFKRTIASQMSEAITERTTAIINTENADANFIATGEVVKFEGFLKVYTEGSDDDSAENDLQKLPKLTTGKKVDLKELEINQRFTRPPARYTEASLVKKLEENGIGRPSTYAPIITTVIKRGYVMKEDRQGVQREYESFVLKDGKITKSIKKENVGYEKAKLFPTDIAMVVTDYLSEHFKDVMNYDFTANVEKDFDEIAAGHVAWSEMLKSFYNPFHETIKTAIQLAERGDGERLLGIDPESGREVRARIGRFGPIIQLGDSDGEQKPLYASLLKDQHIETITLEDALTLLKNENGGRLLGVDPQTGKNVYARIGRFGPMVQLGENEGDADGKPKYASILKPNTVETVTLVQALKFLELPRVVGQYNGKNVTVAVGRFGPYVAFDGKFVSLKKTDDPLTITYERTLQLIAEKLETDSKRLIKEFDENFKIIKDRWGKPNIYYKKKYYKLAKDVDAANLSMEDCLKIIGADAKTEKKTTTKKATAKKTSKSKE